MKFIHKFIPRYHSRVKIDFYFEFLMLSFIFRFTKKGKRNIIRFHFHGGTDKRIT